MSDRVVFLLDPRPWWTPRGSVWPPSSPDVDVPAPPPPQKVGSSAPTTRPGHLSSGSDWNKTRRWNGEEEERKMKMKEEEEEKKNW